jgi:hypothetical protein
MNGFRNFTLMALICILLGILYVLLGYGDVTIEHCTYGPGWNVRCK